MQNKIENKISFKKGRIILVFLILEYGEKYRWRTIEIELFRFDIYIYISWNLWRIIASKSQLRGR